MKRRGLRAALTAGAIGLAVVAAIVAFNWGVVRDHVEAWWFVATRETKEMRHEGMAIPSSRFQENGDTMSPQKHTGVGDGFLLQIIANDSRLPVIYDATAEHGSSDLWRGGPMLLDEAIRSLQEVGYRILEQRFPRAAYVVVGYPGPGSSSREPQLWQLGLGLRPRRRPP